MLMKSNAYRAEDFILETMLFEFHVNRIPVDDFLFEVTLVTGQ
jgi:hypothetical protein